MRINSSLILLLILAASVVPAAGQSDHTVKAILLEHTVELVPKRENDAADFAINVLVDGKLLKQFAAQNVWSPNVVATFNGLNADYLVYRSHSGNGACVGGDIFVLKFNDSSPGQKIDVAVSPVLSGCFGENPPVSFDYDAKFNVIISLGVDKIHGDLLNRWVRAPKPGAKPVRRKTT